MAGLGATLLLMMQAADAVPAPDTAAEADRAMNRYRHRTSAVIPCRAGASGDEIVICARRRADLYRVPLVVNDGPPRDSAAARVDSLRLPSPCESGSIFLVGCGMVGVTVSTSFGPGGVGQPSVRPLAP